MPLYDSGTAADRLYYVTPYIEGESLRQRLERERQLPLEEALRLTREVASALGHAHQRGIVHRDIKPENILLADGLALVADFGIARALGRSQAGSTTVGTALGTPTYMAPEQALGSVEVDGRADLYALACVLYEMLAGVPPFVGPGESLAYQHLSVEPRAVTDLRPAVPSGVAAALARGLAKAPADRYATAARFAEAVATVAMATPAPSSADAVRVRHNLPGERTRFIGRERELAECARLLDETRLLTVTGIGGCGKTRFAIKLAESLLDSFPAGVWFVDLAPVAADGHVAEAAAAVLGVREEAGKDVVAMLRQHVRDHRTLLVLDNCEHLLAPCASLADALLREAESMRILATSREGLGVAGERQWALQPLTVPVAGSGSDRAAVETSEAVQLFVERARASLKEFQLAEGNLDAVAEICRRLDGIPLAIELAAARVKVLSADQIRTRLDDRFRLLTTGSRTGLARHQTLRATIQWSYDQLTSDEQRLLRGLTVFAGGWTLEAGSRVAGGGAEEFEVLDLLARLVDKSLVVVSQSSGQDPRYGMLETVRQYGLERLVESGEVGEARARHLVECLALAERAYAGRAEDEEAWAATLEAEHDNLRVALETARATDPERYLELAGALGWFWYVRSHLADGSQHLTAALAGSPSDPVRPARARALWGGAQLAAWQGVRERAMPAMEQAIAIWRKVDDPIEVALGLEGLGWARVLADEVEGALRAFEEALELQRRQGNPVLIHRAMVGVAQALVALHRVTEARALSEQVLAFAEPRGDRRTEHFACHFLGDCALIEGTPGEALRHYRRSLALARAVKDRVETTFELQGVAMSLAGLGDGEVGLRLAGSVEAEKLRLGMESTMGFWEELLERYLGAARETVGPEAARRALDIGRAIPFDEAVALALGEREMELPTVRAGSPKT